MKVLRIEKTQTTGLLRVVLSCGHFRYVTKEADVPNGLDGRQMTCHECESSKPKLSAEEHNRFENGRWS